MPVYGPCGPWFGPWFIFPIICLLFMVVMMFLMFRRHGPFSWFMGHHGWGPSDHGASGGESALDILKRRYASGEITREQYEQMRRDIE